MRCEGCGAEVMLGSAGCSSCGRSLVATSTPDDPPDEPTTEYLPPPPVPLSFDAPPPPPPGWTIEDGPARAALLPPPPAPRSAKTSTPTALRAPTNTGGCGCGVVIAIVVLGIVAAIGGAVYAATDAIGEPGERVPAPALALGSVVEFEIGDDDTAVHPLELGEGAVTITVRSLDSDFDPVLTIVDADGAVLGTNDDADGHDSRLSFTLGAAADFEVEVSEFSGDAGPYEVAVVSGATPPELEPVDPNPGERIEAEDLVVGDAIQRHLGLDDVAVHHLDGFEGRVAITVTGFDGFDPVVQVYDADGGLVIENDDHDGVNSLVTFVLSPGDDFDVEVREFSGDAGFYSVLLQRGDGESGSPPVLGEVLRRDQPVDGEVGREQAALHEFTGDGEAIVVTVEGDLGFDPVVRVLSAAGDELAENDDSDGLDSRVELTIGAEQTVTVEVTGYNGQPGLYRVLVT